MKGTGTINECDRILWSKDCVSWYYLNHLMEGRGYQQSEKFPVLLVFLIGQSETETASLCIIVRHCGRQEGIVPVKGI